MRVMPPRNVVSTTKTPYDHREFYSSFFQLPMNAPSLHVTSGISSSIFILYHEFTLVYYTIRCTIDIDMIHISNRQL